MPDRKKPAVLCVDDEPNVLEGLGMHLRRHYDVLTATSGRDALAILRERPEVAVVVSDMRMPSMDGAAFLAKARELVPNAARILLTGQTDLESAISAVNDGQIFRFLTKPCAPSTLLSAIEAGCEQHRLLNSERVLLEQTLHGSIKALTELLSLADPVSFGRADRVKRLAASLCAELNVEERWYIEVAAMLSQIANITLPNETAEKLQRGAALDAHEQQMVNRLPAVTERLLGHIPRLEPVRELLADLARPTQTGAHAIMDARAQKRRRAASLLRIALDYDAHQVSGMSDGEALHALEDRLSRYDATILDALKRLQAQRPSAGKRAVPAGSLKVGMVFSEDFRSSSGILLAARGFEVTEGFLARILNLRPGSIPDLVHVQ